MKGRTQFLTYEIWVLGYILKASWRGFDAVKVTANSDTAKKATKKMSNGDRIENTCA